MRCLTVWQPWASLIACGVKTIETRSWRAPERLIGERIGIHAATRAPADGMRLGPYEIYRQADATRLVDLRLGRWIKLPLGAVVCTARLAGCVPIIDRPIDDADVYVNDDTLWLAGPVEYQWTGVPGADEPICPGGRIDEQRPYGDFTPGRYAWLLDELERCDPPIPARGRQRLWKWNLNEGDSND